VGIATWHDLSASSLREKKRVKIDKVKDVEVGFL